MTFAATIRDRPKEPTVFNCPIRRHRAGRGRTYLALVAGADVPDGQQPVVARHAAVPADPDPGQRVDAGPRDGHRQVGRVGRGHVPELDQRLQRGLVRQRQQPEQFGPSAPFVQVHPDGLLLFLAHLNTTDVSRVTYRDWYAFPKFPSAHGFLSPRPKTHTIQDKQIKKRKKDNSFGASGRTGEKSPRSV